MNTDLSTDAPIYEYPGDYYTHETVESRAEAVYGALADARGVKEAAGYLLDMGQPIVITKGTAGAYKTEKLPRWIPWPEYRVTRDGEFNTNKNPVMELEDLHPDGRLIIEKGNGIAIAPSLATGLVVIDADKPEEVQALSDWYTEVTGEALPEPTVKTPGKQDDDGNWKHSSGGHWYLQLPPADPGYDPEAYKGKAVIERGDSKFDIMAGRNYAIAPPSRRTEGAYKLNGDIILADKGTALYEAVMEALDKTVRASRTPAETPVGLTPVFTPEATGGHSESREWATPDGLSTTDRGLLWEGSTPWPEVLAGTPVSLTGKSECGGTCHEVHREGATTERSGVAHEATCGNESLAGRLIFFSSTAEGEDGTSGMGKLTAYTKYIHNGDYKAAIAALRLRDEDQPGYDPTARRRNQSSGSHQDDQGDNDTDTAAKGRDIDAAVEYTKTAFETYKSTGGRYVYREAGEITLSDPEEILDAIITDSNGDAGRPVSRNNAQSALATARRRAKKNALTVTIDPRTLADRDDDTVTYTYAGGDKPVLRIAPGTAELQETLPSGLAFSGGAGKAMDIDLTAGIDDLDLLWPLININPEERLLIAAWLIQRWTHTTGGIPILFFKGSGGRGKTETANYLKNLVDPMGARLDVSVPKNPEEARVTFSESGALVLDNVGGYLTEEQSNLLCRAATGGSEAGRALFTDATLRVTSFRLGLILTAIEAPAMADDLQTRTLLMEPPVLTKNYPGGILALERDKKELAPKIRGALANLAAAVKAELPDLPPLAPGETDRLDHYQATLRAIHKITGWGDPNSIHRVKARLRKEALPEVIELLLDYHRPWHGSVSEIATALNTARGPVSPGTTAITRQRVLAALRAPGMVETLESAYTVKEEKRGDRGSVWTLTPRMEESLTTDLT